MFKTFAIAAALTLAFAGAADAKSCKDAKGKFTKCPAAAAAPAAAGGMASMAGHPQCKKGKPCGASCIAMNKVCHK
jgi:hypothetical protein